MNHTISPFSNEKHKEKIANDHLEEDDDHPTNTDIFQHAARASRVLIDLFLKEIHAILSNQSQSVRATERKNEILSKKRPDIVYSKTKVLRGKMYHQTNQNLAIFALFAQRSWVAGRTYKRHVRRIDRTNCVQSNDAYEVALCILVHHCVENGWNTKDLHPIKL
jgi:hypothetical protein